MYVRLLSFSLIIYGHGLIDGYARVFDLKLITNLIHHLERPIEHFLVVRSGYAKANTTSCERGSWKADTNKAKASLKGQSNDRPGNLK